MGREEVGAYERELEWEFEFGNFVCLCQPLLFGWCWPLNSNWSFCVLAMLLFWNLGGGF